MQRNITFYPPPKATFNEDILIAVFKFFSVEDKTRLSLVCKDWKKVIDDHYVEAILVCNTAGLPAEETIQLIKEREVKSSWRQLYSESRQYTKDKIELDEIKKTISEDTLSLRSMREYNTRVINEGHSDVVASCLITKDTCLAGALTALSCSAVSLLITCFSCNEVSSIFCAVSACCGCQLGMSGRTWWIEHRELPELTRAHLERQSQLQAPLLQQMHDEHVLETQPPVSRSPH